MAVRKAAATKAPAKKATAKKAPVKKAAVKKATVKAVVDAPKPIKAIKERYSKTKILNQISENTELSRKQVQSVLDEISDLIEGHIKKRSCGEFVLPGLLKVVAVKKPARKARKGRNPATGEEMMFAPKPASITVKVRPLKKLKEMPL
ncbi:MAG: nucleoid DNA-binding protein [Flavobacteriales bacterium]|jgi:nucleoid DNA-binding protein